LKLDLRVTVEARDEVVGAMEGEDVELGLVFDRAGRGCVLALSRDLAGGSGLIGGAELREAEEHHQARRE
jgi:hypothetical protein